MDKTNKFVKFTYNGEEYYYLNNKITDTSFIVLDDNLNKEVGNFYFSQFDYKNFSQDELISFIKEIKNNNLFNLTTKICEYALNKFDNHEQLVKNILPILTSAYRLLNQSHKVISLASKYLHNKTYQSVPLLTSVAAAYCDLGDAVSAKKTADYAYRLQGGGMGYKNELSLVYMRIKKMME